MITEPTKSGVCRMPRRTAGLCDPACRRGRGAVGPITAVGTQEVQPLRKMVWWFFTKLNILFPYHTGIVPPGANQWDLKTHVLTETHTRTFMAALVTIGTVVSSSWRRDKLWSIQPMKHYSSPKRNELLAMKQHRGTLNAQD